MIELVAALSLMLVILGALAVILNAAASLWSASSGRQREQAVGQNVLELMTDDLQQAVTDTGTSPSEAGPWRPTFVLDARTNQPPSEVQVLLQFARPRPRHVRTRPDTGVPWSLSAVYYTFYRNALFRHVVPLEWDPAQPKPLGERLYENRPLVTDTPLHDRLLDPTLIAPVAEWDCALLAERLDVVACSAALPSAWVRPDHANQTAPGRALPNGLSLPPVFDYLETDVLPDQLDLALRLNSEEDWQTLARLENDTSEQSLRRRALLGRKFTKRIVFQTQGGSRLP